MIIAYCPDRNDTAMFERSIIEAETCPDCNGDQKKYFSCCSDEITANTYECPTCGDHCQPDPEDCETCKGEGVI